MIDHIYQAPLEFGAWEVLQDQHEKLFIGTNLVSVVFPFRV